MKQSSHLNTPINFSLLKRWDELRKIENKTKQIFSLASNKFSFKRASSEAATLHIYIGYDSDVSQVSFTLVKKSIDTNSNNECICICNLHNGAKVALPNYNSREEPMNPHQINWEVASERINSWIDTSVRNNWVKQRFQNNDNKEAIQQAFVMDAMDIEVGVTHDCYLALNFSNSTQRYAADLIVVNSVNNKLVNNLSEEQLNIEDLVCPVPPFGKNNNRASFGALLRINGQG